MEKMKLNIQRFADEGATTTDTASVEKPEANTEDNSSQELSFTDLLKKPEYQREFDKLVNKSINTAKSNWEKDYNAKLEAEKTEAEKLAKMDADQKMQYELDMQVKCSVQETASGTARTILVKRLFCRFYNTLVSREASIGIRAEHQYLVSTHLNLSTLFSGNLAEIGIHASLHKFLRLAVILVSFL